MKQLLKSNIICWVAVIAWMALIFTLSAQSNLPDLTPGMPNLQDVVGHLTVYAVLAMLWFWALASIGVRHAALWAGVISFLYGMSDEYHQSFVPGRTMTLADLGVDLVAILIALLLLARLHPRFHFRSRFRRPSAPP